METGQGRAVTMPVTRRTAIKLLSGAVPAYALGRSLAVQSPLDIQKGPFEGTRESLQQYAVPDWFRDAKFGIWAHWGPQSAVEQGDWYARNMYIQGSRQYEYHVARYGHPSKFGYKDICPSWHAADFDADHLMSLYRKAGARYFVSMGVHHDNFDLWDSKYTRWNAVKMGPHKDIVGLWRKAATKRGLRFGVTEHLWISYKWFAVSHGSDSTGPLAGVSYDGVSAADADLYHDAGCLPWAHASNPRQLGWDDAGVPDSWKQHWFLRIKDLVNQYQPDLLYTDGPLPFESYGYSVVANLYNQSAKRTGGNVEAVYTSKQAADCAMGTCVLDFERGLANQIRPAAWQTDTCIGGWHYDVNVFRDHRYKTAKGIVDMLVDVVSQNGNLLLNFPLPNSGVLDSDELQVLEGITRWMGVNSEAIYDTRPWKIYGEGPGTRSEQPGSSMNERSRQPLTAEEVRFTTKGHVLYAVVMGWPGNETTVQALGTASPQQPGKILNVELLGHQDRLSWAHQPAGLRVQLPAERPCDYAVTLKVTFA
jgi:alpha-L-fucosidase